MWGDPMPNQFHKNIRMSTWDYSQPAVYMVTICVSDRSHRFGDISDEGELALNNAGKMVRQEINNIQIHHPVAEVLEYVVMPNHVHFLVGINLTLDAPTSTGLPDMVGGFKSRTTNRYIKGIKLGLLPPFNKKLWQEGYYETVMRDERMTEERRQYIVNNPANWQRDPEMNYRENVTHKG